MLLHPFLVNFHLISWPFIPLKNTKKTVKNKNLARNKLKWNWQFQSWETDNVCVYKLHHLTKYFQYLYVSQRIISTHLYLHHFYLFSYSILMKRSKNLNWISMYWARCSPEGWMIGRASTTQPTFSCSKSTMEHHTIVWNLFRVDNKDSRTTSMTTFWNDVIVDILVSF